VVEQARSSDRDPDRDPRLAESGGVVAPIAAPRPEDYPELSPEQRARFEERWVKNPRGLEALRYLAK
jgi:hypothetical protein